MSTLNERLRFLRKELGLSQTEFAASIGVSQRAISWSEQIGSNVPASTIKAICLAHNVSENWLRTGEGPIYNEGEAFSLDRWAKEHGATELELEIVKVYFELDPSIRQAVMDHFKAHFANAVDPDEAEAEALKQDFLRQRKAEAASSATAGDDGARHTG